MAFIEPPFWARTWRMVPPHVAVKVIASTPPPAEPLDVVEARAHLGQAITDDDELIARYVSAARVYIENRIGKPLRRTVVDVFLDPIAPRRWISLPIGPLIEVTEIGTTTSTDVETIVAPTVYLVDDASQPARILVREGQYWPTDLRLFQAVRLRLVVGYVTVPEDLLQALRLLVAHFYENRVATTLTATGMPLTAIPLGLDALLAPYEMVVVG